MLSCFVESSAQEIESRSSITVASPIPSCPSFELYPRFSTVDTGTGRGRVLLAMEKITEESVVTIAIWSDFSTLTRDASRALSNKIPRIRHRVMLSRGRMGTSSVISSSRWISWFRIVTIFVYSRLFTALSFRWCSLPKIKPSSDRTGGQRRIALWKYSFGVSQEMG